MTPKPDGLRAPDEETSLGFKDSSEKGHKTCLLYTSDAADEEDSVDI